MMTTDAIMRLRLTSKSTLLETSMRRPFEAMRPKSKRHTPPMTGLGMDWMSAANLGQNPPITSAKPPAYQKICVEYTRVTLMTPMFSA